MQSDRLTRRFVLSSGAGFAVVSHNCASVAAVPDLSNACRDMFLGHRVEAFGERFHVPATREYGCLFSWDCGYHALALQHIAPMEAVAELQALFRSNTCDDGLLAHERPLPGADARTSLVVKWLGPLYRPDGRSWLIDPPVGAFAAARLYVSGIVTDRALLTMATRSLDAIDAHRQLRPDGTPVLLHPLESGADASPLFDALVDASGRDALLRSHRAISVHAEGVRYDPHRAIATGHSFVVSDPIFCSWNLLALEELALAWRTAGDRDRAVKLDARAGALADAMVRDLWSPKLKMFVGYDHVGGRKLEVATLGGVIAGASRHMIASGYAAQIVEAHLDARSSAFWGARGVAFNPLNGRSIDPDGLVWRGDVVWGATQYWAYLVLSRNGRSSQAQTARAQMAALINTSGFREYYSANTGEGYGAGARGGFTWPALVLDMIDQA